MPWRPEHLSARGLPLCHEGSHSLRDYPFVLPGESRSGQASRFKKPPAGCAGFGCFVAHRLPILGVDLGIFGALAISVEAE